MGREGRWGGRKWGDGAWKGGNDSEFDQNDIGVCEKSQTIKRGEECFTLEF